MGSRLFFMRVKRPLFGGKFNCVGFHGKSLLTYQNNRLKQVILKVPKVHGLIFRSGGVLSGDFIVRGRSPSPVRGLGAPRFRDLIFETTVVKM